MELKVLHQHGWSLSALAREFGLNWRTVKREVSSPAPRRYPARAKPTALTEAQLAHVARRLAVCPTIRGTDLHRELRENYTYAGSYPAFARHLRTIRPPVPVEPVIRFETAPGVQLQVDWAHLGAWPLGTRMGTTLVELKVLVAILGYSRAPALRFATDTTRATTLDCVLGCLDDLGGVPKEVLTDRDPAFCIGATGDGRAILAPEWVDLCEVLGTVPKACRPYRAKTKGKVERMVREVKESFLAWLSGESVPAAPTLADYDILGRRWITEVVLPRRHRTTQRRVGHAWAEERELLVPVLPRLSGGAAPVALAPGPVLLGGLGGVGTAQPARPAPTPLRAAGEHVEVRDLGEYDLAAAPPAPAYAGVSR